VSVAGGCGDKSKLFARNCPALIPNQGTGL
jgi:hypothetical protein